jgi:hypothetical protein|tara:strand:+ start:871 stop:1041 length:171 start_codon:yes stop_codon:yes gene_type:complete
MNPGLYIIDQGNFKITGGASATVAGAIYSPAKKVKISSGTTLSGSCLQIAADTAIP